MLLFPRNNRNNSGFTLIEVVVALTIVAMMAGLMMSNYREGEKINKLVLQSQELSTDIRKVQNNTLGAAKYGTSTPEGGWGIHIDLGESEKEYKLFANKNYDSDDDGDPDNFEYDSGEALPEKGGQTMELEEGVKIASTTVGDYLDITFIPPDPKTVFWDGSSTTSDASITLENKSGTTRKVKVNSFGSIEVVK